MILKQKNFSMKKETGDMIKVVIFTDHEDASCCDEKWRRFQLILPDITYEKLKQAILKIEKKYDC